jgi:Tfp pilus assembly protein PilX
MKSLLNHVDNDRGSVLLIALLILALLTIIGISATTTAQIETLMAGDIQARKIAFHHADSGVWACPKLISPCVDADTKQTITSGSYTPNDGTFYREIMGFDSHDAATDVQLILAGFTVDLDVNRIGQEFMPGGVTEFSSGADGIGMGSPGGTAVLYGITASGNGPKSSQARVSAIYQKVLGVPGGL